MSHERPQELARCVVVVPCPTWPLVGDAVRSFRRTRDVLGRWPIVLAVPERIAEDVRRSAQQNVGVVAFGDHDFRSVDAYNQLMLSQRFYRAFEAFEFMLLVQLDALVLRDEVDAWCDRGYDYVGAPWLHRTREGVLEAWGVGNGGFSLRRIDAALEILTTRRRIPGETARPNRHPGRRVATLIRDRVLFPYSAPPRATRCVEDVWWGRAVPKVVPSFRVAPPSEALAFAFETYPREMYLQLGRLPFGVHGWRRYGESFWLDALPFLRDERES